MIIEVLKHDKAMSLPVSYIFINYINTFETH